MSEPLFKAEDFAKRSCNITDHPDYHDAEWIEVHDAADLANAKRDDELGRLRESAKNGSAWPTAWDYAVHLEGRHDQLRELLRSSREALDKLAFCKYGDKTLWVEYEDWEHAMFTRDRIDESGLLGGPDKRGQRQDNDA